MTEAERNLLMALAVAVGAAMHGRGMYEVAGKIAKLIDAVEREASAVR